MKPCQLLKHLICFYVSLSLCFFKKKEKQFHSLSSSLKPCLLSPSETKVKEARPGGRKVVVESRSVEIQTAAPAGLSYQWLSQTGVSLMAPSYGLDAVDPTPIAATVISPDALESQWSFCHHLQAVCVCVCVCMCVCVCVCVCV